MNKESFDRTFQVQRNPAKSSRSRMNKFAQASQSKEKMMGETSLSLNSKDRISNEKIETTTKFKFAAKSPNKTFQPTMRRGNGIPEKYIARIEFLYQIFHNESFLSYYNLAQPRVAVEMEEMAKYFSSYTNKKNGRNIIDIYAQIYYFICRNISYDVANLHSHKRIDSPAETAFKTGVALSEGYARLYESMCKIAGLKCRRVVGFLKGVGFKPGDDCERANHMWNVINIKGDWYFVDPTLGSGFLDEDFQYIQAFNPYYFLTPPVYLIDSHRPMDDDWQLTPKIITPKQFSCKPSSGLGMFFQKVFQHDIQLITHDYPIIYSPSTNLVIKLGVQNMTLLINLFQGDGKTKICEVNYVLNDKTNVFIIETALPENGDYILSIYARPIVCTDLIYTPLIKYKIRVNDVHLIKKEITGKDKEKDKIREKSTKNSRRSADVKNTLVKKSSAILNLNVKKKCYDNVGAYLFEPKTSVLKIGADYLFKVRVKDVLSVAVLDGRKFNYLKKREEDIWENMVTIQSENVTICSLKSTNVFTEVFEFPAKKY